MTLLLQKRKTVWWKTYNSSQEMYRQNPFVQLSVSMLTLLVDTAGEAKDVRALLCGDNGVISKRCTVFLVDLYVQFPVFSRAIEEVIISLLLSSYGHFFTSDGAKWSIPPLSSMKKSLKLLQIYIKMYQRNLRTCFRCFLIPFFSSASASFY